MVQKTRNKRGVTLFPKCPPSNRHRAKLLPQCSVTDSADLSLFPLASLMNPPSAACFMLHAACSSRSTNLGLQVIACDFPKGCLHFSSNLPSSCLRFFHRRPVPVLRASGELLQLCLCSLPPIVEEEEVFFFFFLTSLAPVGHVALVINSWYRLPMQTGPM